LDGVVGGAFHPLILLGYGLDITDEDLILDSLAFLCFDYKPLGKGIPGESKFETVLELFDYVRLNAPHKDTWKLSGFSDKLGLFIANEQDFLRVCDRVPCPRQ